MEGAAPQDAPASRPAHGLDTADIPAEDLRRLYEDYRVRQARSLLSLVPRSAVRPLYRRARGMSEAFTEAVEDGGSGSALESGSVGSDDDPMAALVAFCEALLPLPTFEVWLDDLRRNPEAHWVDVESSADTPSPTAPATLDSRRLRFGTLSWKAHLRGFRDRDAWRGFIAFEETGVVPRRVHRTALIFREDTVQDLRDRFRGFQPTSLEAFLRSSLP